MRGRTDPGLRDRAHARDAELQERGALVGMAGAPVQVRNTEFSGVRTQEGAFLSSALPIAGFVIIEAADLAAAIEMVSHSPCAVAHGVVEVWPLKRS